MYLEGERVMEDVVYAEANDDGIILRDVVGESKSFRSVFIAEVNVPAARLVLRKA